MAHTMMMPLIYHPVLCHLEIPNEENFSGKTNFSVLIPYIVLLRVNLVCTMKSILIGQIDSALLICTEKNYQIISCGTLNLFLTLGTLMDCAQVKVLFIEV